MTQQEIETLLKQLQQQVELNTTAIQQIADRFNSYSTLSSLYSISSAVSAVQASVSTLQTQVATLQTSIGLVNKLSKLIDVNITNSLAKDDLLQWDGDRWTNIKPSKLGISDSSGGMSLEGLSDVSISNKSNGQALVWSNSLGKWTNGTVSGGGSGLDVAAMWQELASSSPNQINPSHITGALSLSGLTVNGSTTLKNQGTQLSVTTSGISINGNTVGTGEITAYSV